MPLFFYTLDETKRVQEMKQLDLNKTGRVSDACWHEEKAVKLQLSVDLLVWQGA